MSWFRCDPDDFWASDEVEAMDLEAAGLLWWLICRSWKVGAIKDDPKHWKALLRGRCARFDKIWPEVRAALTECNGELRCLWLEEERDSSVGRLKSEAERKKQKRLSIRTEGHSSAGQSQEVPRPSAGSPKPESQSGRSTYGRTDGQDGRTDSWRADARKSDHPPDVPPPEVEVWPKAFAEHPSLDKPECHAAYRRWVAYRRSAGLKVWRLATIRGSLTKLEAHGPGAFCTAVDESISNGWSGLFPPKVNGHTPKDSMRAAFAAQSACAESPEPEEVSHEDIR